MPDDKDKKEEFTITMDDLKDYIAAAMKDGAVLQTVRDEIGNALKVEKEAIFGGNGDGKESGAAQSVIDTSAFSKEYPSDGAKMAKRLKAFGGPWLSLSPVMEKFALICASRGDFREAEMRGVNVKEYNAEVAEYNAQYIKQTPLTTTNVGALVPIEFLATVVEFANAQSKILPKLWRIPMGSMTLRIPKLVQAAGSYFGGITLYHVDEGGLKTETKPEFDTLTFEAKKLIGLITLTDELIADSAINIVNYITGLFTRALQYQVESEVINGTGAGGQMLGIINDPGINVVARQGAGTVVYDDFINLESSLDENFQNLTWLSRRATINTLRKQKDTTTAPIFEASIERGVAPAMPPTILGYPYALTRNVPALGVTGDVTLGDLSYYIWAVRQEMTIDSSKERYFEYDLTALRFVLREDGKPGISEAFAVLEGTGS